MKQAKEVNNSIEELPELDQKLLDEWKSRRIKLNTPPPLEKIQLKESDFNRLSPELSKATPREVEKTGIIPKNILDKFVQMDGKFYFKNRTNDLAFVDHGNKLSTSIVNKNLSKSFVDIAKARGWTSIQAKGKNDFKREIWLEASRIGIVVDGYKPNEVDYIELKKRAESNTPRSEKLTTETITTDNSNVVNEQPFKTLKSHGAAPYLNKKNNSKSYYAVLEDQNGNEEKLWGKNIEEALRKSKAQVGDKIILEKGSKENVTVPEKSLNKETGKIETTLIDTYRNEWNVTKLEDVKKRDVQSKAIKNLDGQELQRKHPELKNEIIALALAEKFAKSSNMSKNDGRRFFNQVRENIAKNTSLGFSMPKIKMKIENERILKPKEHEHEH